MSRSLGSLTVDLIARTGGFQDGMNRAERSAQRANQGISRGARQSSKDIEGLGSSSQVAARQLKQLATIAGTAFAGIKLTSLIREAAELNSRYEQLGGIMTVVGRNAGMSADQVNKYAKEVQGMGITMMESRQTVISMTQAQLDLSKASELARAAQDAAAVAGVNSSEALRRIISGIQSNNVEVLRGVGLNVNFEQSYRDMEAQLGRTRGELTEAEKAQARMNVTLEAATQIAGSYEASMDSAAKQLGSTARYIEDITILLGGVFSDATRQAVFGYSDALKGLHAQAKALSEDGTLERWSKNLATGMGYAADAAKALAAVLGGRLLASLAAVVASKAVAIQQAVAYQLALARMAGVSTAAAAGQVALAGAVTAARGALALVGGPVGVAVIAAAGIYSFREELGLVPYNASRASEEIDKLAGSISAMSVATAEFNLINAREQLADAERSFATTQRSIEFFQEELAREVSPPKVEALEERLVKLRKTLEDTGEAAAGWRKTISELEGVMRASIEGYTTKEDILRKLGGSYRDVGTGAGEASKEVEKIIERLEQEQRQLTKNSKEMLLYTLAQENATEEEIKRALAIHGTNENLKENKRATDAARKAVEQMLEAESKAAAVQQQTMDAARRHAEVLGRQVAVVGRGTAAQEALNRELFLENQLRSESYKTLLPHQQEEYRRLIETQYDLQRELEVNAEQAQLFESNWLRGVERVRDGFGDFFERMIVDGKASFRGLTDLFKKMIAEMIATAAANRIMIGLGLVGGASGAAAGGSGGGGSVGGVGISDIFSTASMIKNGQTLWQGFSGMMGGQGFAGFMSEAAFEAAVLEGGLEGAFSMSHQLSAAFDKIMSNIGGMWPLAVIAGMYQSGKLYDKGVRPDAGDMWDSSGSNIFAQMGNVAATGMSAVFSGLDSILSPLVGGKAAAMLTGSTFHQALWEGINSAIWGTGYQTTRGGFELGFGDEGFDPQSWERQTKKGGLFGSTKRRYVYSDLDEELDAMLSATYDMTIEGVRGLYSMLGVSVEEGLLEGVQIASLKIGTAGKSKQTEEAIQSQLEEWFVQLQEAAVSAVDGSLDFASLEMYAASLMSVNEVFGAIGLSAYDVSLEGGKAAVQLLALSGGIENLLTATDFYYQNFYSAHERMGLLTEQTAAAFEAMGLALPESRQGFRDIVEGIDQTTEEGRLLFLQLLNIAPAFADLTGRMGDLDREADELRIELLKLSGDMEGAAAASKALATDGMSALEIASWERNQSLLQQIEEQRRAQEELTRAENDQIRAALEAADAAQKLATEQERAAQQMARAQAQALSSIERSIGGLRERIILDQLGTPEAQYGYYKSQIDAMGVMIGGLSSPDAIASLVGQMTSLAGSAYGLLGEDGQKERGSEYLTFLDNLQHQSTQAIEKAEQKKAEQQAKILKEAMAEAGKIMAETIKVAIEDGSLEIQQAGVVMTAATNAFASKVNELNRSREVTG